MNLTILEAQDPYGAVLDNTLHDLVQIRTTLDEEAVIALQNDVLIADELHQLERSGTDNVLRVARMLLGILAISVDVFRNHCTQLGRECQ